MAQQQTPKQVDKFIVSNKVLGKGQFGQVFRGYYKDNLSKVVAVKQIALTKASSDPKFIKLLKREIEILFKVKNDYIVAMYHATRTPNNLYMFLEYCGDGDLKEYLKSRGGKLTESEAVIFFRQIVEGFRTLYELNVIHRDIKPANILLKDGKAKISDFGFAKCLDQTEMENQVKQTYLGTPLYMAPQILMEETFSCKCDIWSLGMMFYEMLYGHTPWTGKTPYALHQNIMKQPLSFPDDPPRSDLVKDMLKKMLIVKDEERISWPELFKHPLISLDQDDIQRQIDEINQNDNIDALLKSVEVNNFYVKKNKVAGIDKTQNNKAFRNPKIQVTECQAQEEEDIKVDHDEPKVNEAITQVIDMGEVFKKQDEEKKLRDATIKIDSYLTFQRNIGIFVNLTTNQIFRFYKEALFSMPEHLFYRIIFVLQKHQLIGFENLLNYMTGPQNQLSVCNPKEWEYYKNSKEFSNTIMLIRNDNGFIRPYFSEVQIRTENYLKGHSSDNKVKKFFQILNSDLSRDNKIFEEVYQETLNELLQIMKNSMQAKKEKRRELLQLIRYIFISKNLAGTFKWTQIHNSVFHEFYDTYDNMPESQLEKEVEQQFKEQDL